MRQAPWWPIPAFAQDTPFEEEEGPPFEEVRSPFSKSSHLSCEGQVTPFDEEEGPDGFGRVLMSKMPPLSGETSMYVSPCRFLRGFWPKQSTYIDVY